MIGPPYLFKLAKESPLVTPACLVGVQRFNLDV
jgi:hypothetical protein